LAHAAGTVYGLAVVAIISSIFALGFVSSSSSLVDQLNSTGTDVWQSGNQDDIASWGASEGVYAGECWVLTFADTQELSTLIDTWYDLQWDRPIPMIWSVGNQALVGPSATASCAVTAAEVLNWDLS
jgi:hypothetical protein